MTEIVVDSLGLSWRAYNDDVLHCPRCHRVIRLYDLPEDVRDTNIALVLAFHNQVWHAELDAVAEAGGVS